MIELSQGAGEVVAGDVRNAFAAVDDALLNSARMYVSIVEATKGSNIPVSQSQKLLVSLTAGMSRVVEGRAEIVSAVREMQSIKNRSNLAPVSYGCPTGWEELAALQSTDVPIPALEA